MKNKRADGEEGDGKKGNRSFELGSKETSMSSNGGWQTAACWTRWGKEDVREKVRKSSVSERACLSDAFGRYQTGEDRKLLFS